MVVPQGRRAAPQPPGTWGTPCGHLTRFGTPHRSPQHHQGSPSKVPLALGVQDLSPSWWLVDAHPSPSSSVKAFQQPQVQVPHPTAWIHPVPCWLAHWHRRCRSCWPLPAAVPPPGALQRQRGAVSYRKHRWGLGRCQLELPMLAGDGSAGRDLAQAADPQGCGSTRRQEKGIKEQRCRHLLAPVAVTPPRWQGARLLAPGHAGLPGAGSERRDAGSMPVAMPHSSWGPSPCQPPCRLHPLSGTSPSG